LRDAAIESLEELFQESAGSELQLFLSLKHDFPTEWHQFLNGTGDFIAPVRRAFFPYFTQGRPLTLDRIQVFAVEPDALASQDPIVDLAGETSDLQSEGQFDLMLPPDEAVLQRDPQTRAFVLISYSL
jgi:hypothetical protein